MILADTNIFIDFWNDAGKGISEVFQKEDIVICGVVRAELLHGAVSDKDLANISTMLDAFDEYNLNDEDWQILGDNLYKLRKNGLTVPFSDAIILTIALKYGISVWTDDKHFKMMQNVFTDLKIYHVS